MIVVWVEGFADVILLEVKTWLYFVMCIALKVDKGKAHQAMQRVKEIQACCVSAPALVPIICVFRTPLCAGFLLG